jgi:hypothetical protein
MKILFDNYIADSTLTALHASLNYPVTNLQDSVLRKRYQCTQDSDTITITFSEPMNVDSFFYAYTNATYLQLRLYRDYETLLFTLTIDDPVEECGAHFFSLVEDVEYAELDIRGSEGVYLGAPGIGDAIDFPDPENTWKDTIQDNSSSSENVYGSTWTDYIEPLRIHNWICREITIEDALYYISLYKLTGIGKPLFIDPFENNHDFMEPLYAKFTNPIDKQKNGRRWQLNIDIKECR